MLVALDKEVIRKNFKVIHRPGKVAVEQTQQEPQAAGERHKIKPELAIWPISR
jgi:hypothetical protein